VTIRTLVALVLLVAPAAAQSFKTVDTFTIEGAHGVIIIPDNWNGIRAEGRRAPAAGASCDVARL